MTLKIISFAFVAFSCLFHSSAVAAQPKLRIWGQIPFVAQGSFLEFRATMGKTREQARKDLLDLFGSLYLPSVMAGADAASAAEALSKVIINFDRLREEHVRYANQGIPEALESRFIAHFEDYYRSEGLSEEERRAEFLRVGGWNDAMKKLRLGSIQSKERDRLFMDLFEKLDYLLYGSYTILSNGGVALTLNAEKYGTGELRSFSAEGNIEQAIAALAREFFEFAQSNARQTWTNPLEGLEWVLPPPNLQGSQLPREIQLFCEGQNARIPFARELVLAAQGGRYRAGGIPVIGPEDIYLVADQQQIGRAHV